MAFNSDDEMFVIRLEKPRFILAETYEDLGDTGIVNLYVHEWIDNVDNLPKQTVAYLLEKAFDFYMLQMKEEMEEEDEDLDIEFKLSDPKMGIYIRKILKGFSG